jgi:lipid II:glycine glycyltransferase (peptidoglycan interpeptide bridge formation enzyme)
MKYEIVDPIKYNGWDDLFKSKKEFTIFHSSSWCKIIQETYGYKPVYLTIIENQNALAVIPMMEIKSILSTKKGVSLPFTDYCPPIIDKSLDKKEILNSIINNAEEFGWKTFELRGADFNVQKSSSFYGHILDLQKTEEEVFSGFRGSLKRNIKKASREGVVFKVDRSLEGMEDYFRLHCLTRKRHGLPPQPFRFFKKIHEHIISNEKGIVLLASYKDIIIAGAVYFNFWEKVLYKFGASDSKYQYLRPNDLVMWEAIKWSIENGYKSFCFGRTDLHNTGLRDFKKGWGTDESIINYYKYDLTKKNFIEEEIKVKGAHNIVFRIMPVPVLKMIGSILYKHAG